MVSTARDPISVVAVHQSRPVAWDGGAVEAT